MLKLKTLPLDTVPTYEGVCLVHVGVHYIAHISEGTFSDVAVHQLALP